MTTQEKALYHQIHPLKLAADWGTGLLALWLLWRRRGVAALVVALVPGVVVSAVLIRWGDLEERKRSPLGRYVQQHMTRRMEAVRLAGFVVMAVGAWNRRPLALPLGVGITLFGWFRGKLVPSGA